MNPRAGVEMRHDRELCGGAQRPGGAAAVIPSLEVHTHAHAADQGREDLPGAAQAGRERGKVGANRERVGGQFAEAGRRQGRKERLLRRLEQGRPGQAGPRDRHQGPVVDDQERTHQRPAQPLNPGPASLVRMPRAPVIVTNDDGIGSEGLWHLAAAAAQAGFDVVVAAPLGEASGTGSAIKAVQDGGRIAIQRRELPEPAAGIPAFAIDATPAFIVFAAVRGAFGPEPRYVLSGINRGPNTGRAVLHSGTVGAAMTASGYGLVSAAFSLDIGEDSGAPEWAAAAQVASEVLPALAGVPGRVVLN